MKKPFFAPLSIQLLVLMLFLSIFSNNCGNDSRASWVIAVEKWRLVSIIAPEYDSIYLTLSKLSDSSITAEGGWAYDHNEYLISCSYMLGEATRDNDSIFLITTTGECVYPEGSPYEGQKSSFTLKIEGVFKNDSSSGTWSAYFNNTFYWPDSLNWNYTGIKISGSGVTL